MSKPAYVVQTFKKVRGGMIVPGDRETVGTESGAIKKAQAMAKRHPGTAALEIFIDTETGEVQSGRIIESFGEVPDDFADTLRGG